MKLDVFVKKLSTALGTDAVVQAKHLPIPNLFQRGGKTTTVPEFTVVGGFILEGNTQPALPYPDDHQEQNIRTLVQQRAGYLEVIQKAGHTPRLTLVTVRESTAWEEGWVVGMWVISDAPNT